MDDNIPDSEFLAYLSGETNQNLLSQNTDVNIPDTEFLARLSGETNNNLEGIKELYPEKETLLQDVKLWSQWEGFFLLRQ